MGHSDSKLPAPQLSPESAQRGVPTTIQAAYKKSWKDVVIYLREPDKEPTFCLSLPGGWYDKAILHDGPEPKHPVLATSTGEGKWRNDFAVTLPAMPGTDMEPSREILRYKVGRREIYWFAIKVGQDKHIERFEWRHSHGAEVKSVGESKWGWKLVRLGGGTQDPSEDTAQGPDRADGLTSDGKEIVAVWADSGDWKSMSKIGTLNLRGSGATGELGTTWALMALMSRMCIWQKEMQVTTTTTVASA
ncbi:hypothetical protein FDECE_7883 [Fusarium decemcellulare]|nr:hypothetical protein FDECE_7883 [Fusarium decemcellulare]